MERLHRTHVLRQPLAAGAHHFGLSVALIILGIQFFMELFHAFPARPLRRKQRTLLPTWWRPAQGTTPPRKPRSCCRCWRWSICRWWQA